MPNCAYCGTPLPGAEQICRDCWDDRYSEIKGTAATVPFTQQIKMLAACAPATTAIIAINCIVFLLVIASGLRSLSGTFDLLQPTERQLVRWGADYALLTLNGQPWRMFTAMFLHIGIFHLFFNMFALLSLGTIVEYALGQKTFLFAYVISGVGSSLASGLWHPTDVAAGASGAIFGLAGLLVPLILFGRLTIKLKKAVLPIGSLVLFCVFNLLLGAVVPQINNAAHVGGLACGLTIGMVVSYWRTSKLLVEFVRPGVIRKSTA